MNRDFSVVGLNGRLQMSVELTPDKAIYITRNTESVHYQQNTLHDPGSTISKSTSRKKPGSAKQPFLRQLHKRIDKTAHPFYTKSSILYFVGMMARETIRKADPKIQNFCSLHIPVQCTLFISMLVQSACAISCNEANVFKLFETWNADEVQTGRRNVCFTFSANVVYYATKGICRFLDEQRLWPASIE
ncbi:unnamed protein product [Clavelina lepadiformis]|uniref:Uncharacterized protein n=1 Tax=Clavelina lepadiformis TaxID=159417 RepID=A0ABP0FKP7_CLALP